MRERMWGCEWPGERIERKRSTGEERKGQEKTILLCLALSSGPYQILLFLVPVSFRGPILSQSPFKHSTLLSCLLMNLMILWLLIQWNLFFGTPPFRGHKLWSTRKIKMLLWSLYLLLYLKWKNTSIQGRIFFVPWVSPEWRFPCMQHVTSTRLQRKNLELSTRESNPWPSVHWLDAVPLRLSYGESRGEL